MARVNEVIYEDGVLKPTKLLKIKEHSQVRIMVESTSARGK